jgi:beta-lactamase class A
VAGVVVLNRTPVPARRGHQSANGEDATKDTTTGSTVRTAAHHTTPGAADLFTQPPVEAYLTAHSAEDVTAAVYDDVTGRTSLYRPDTAEVTASIMKVDILATLLAQSQARGQALTPADQTLSQSMIELSDNDDAQDLWDSEGGAAGVQSFDTEAGLTQTTPDAAGYWGLSTTTAADQVQLMRTVAYPNGILSPASQSYELGLMSHVETDEAWGITSGPGADATVALKNGWLPLDSGGWQVNSMGHIDGDGRNYVIAVLTDGATEANGIATIEGLSGLIWQELAPAA